MRDFRILLLVLFFQSFAFSQEIEDAWLYFKDKPSMSTYMSNPLLMLTQKSLDRRTAQSISLDIKDVPIENSYVSSIASSTGIVVKARSKWLNALHITGTKSNIDLLLNLTFVDSIEFANKGLNKSILKKKQNRNKISKTTEVDNFDYGATSNQITMLNGHFLHDLDYTGTGLQIAIMDAGFKGVETFSVFSRLRDANLANGEILGGYDFVHRSTDFYADLGTTHGLSVLSTIGAYSETEYIGTAPNAQFYLFVTEDYDNESPLEESLWVEAVEKADSLGVDIVNTSLGYTTFDDSSYNYSYADLDGKTTFISRGSEIASSRGMLMVTSAGNSGSSSWHYIGAPADAASGLTVGAVDASENSAFFSSYGPTSDHRIKPEVLAQGQNVFVINSIGNIAKSNGTSFSGPIMSGMAACLWQAFPSKNSNEIKNLIVESSDLYLNPTSQRGYGIPDFESIYNTVLSVESNINSTIGIYPNPASDNVFINFHDKTNFFHVRILSLFGNVVFESNNYISNSSINLEGLASGIYIIQVISEENTISNKFIKK